MRAGAEYFTTPTDPAQRRYEALRVYLVDGEPAEVAGARVGYSKATMYQMAAELRAGRTEFVVSSKPGPKGPRQTATLRDRVLDLRAADRSVKEIADALTVEGTPISHQSVWVIPTQEGLSRLPPRARRGHGPAPRMEAVRAAPLVEWPAGTSVECDHAGLFVLLPAMVELGLPEVIAAGGYPSNPQPHVLALDGLAAQPEAAATQPGHPRHRTGAGWRPGPGRGVERAAQSHPRFQPLLPGAPPDEHRRAPRTGPPAAPPRPRHRRRRVQPRLPRHPPPRGAGPARGQLRPQTLPVHSIGSGPLRPGPRLHRDGLRQRRCHQTRSRPQVLAFADHWKAATGSEPGLLVFDSKLTTYAVLDELSTRGIEWLTLRQRGKRVLDELAALPASAWKSVRIDRAGRYRHPQLHEDIITSLASPALSVRSPCATSAETSPPC